MTEKTLNVKVIWNVVGFVKWETTTIPENVYKAYGKNYFEIVKATNTEETKKNTTKKK